MTRYNTGNRVGSSDPRDLYDNAENLDGAINGTGAAWVDRLGESRISWEGFQQNFEKFLADGSTIEFATWAEASAAAAASQIPLNRQVAVIGDTGTHVDPTNGATVPNSGRYVMLSSGLQWRSADVLTQKANSSDVAIADASISQIGGKMTFGRAIIGIGDGIAGAGNTVADRKGFTVSGQLTEIRVYARVAGTASLKIISRQSSGSFDGEVVASYPVNLRVGVNSLKAGIDFPATYVYAGWTWGMFTTAAILARQSGSSNQTMTVSGDVSASATWANTANTTQWQADIVSGGYVKDAAVSASQLAAQALGLSSSAVVEGFSLSGGTAFTSSNTTRIVYHAAPYKALVKRVSFVSNGATGFGFLKFMRKNLGDYTNTYTVESDHYFLPVSGQNDLIAGRDFPEGIYINGLGAIGVYLSAHGVSYVPSSDGGSLTATSNITGSANFTSSSAQVNVEIELQYDYGDVPQSQLLIDEPLSTSDRVFQAGGTWEFDGQGVLSPNGGDSVLYRSEYSVMDPTATSVRFKITQSGAVFGVAKRAHEDQGPASGTVAMYDASIGQLQLILWTRWDIAIPTEPARFVNVPFSFDVGDEGVLELKHVGATNTATITKSRTRETISLEHVSAGDSITGRCWGQPSIVARSGRTRFLGMQYRLLTSRRPRLAVGIDSITEGFNLANNWSQRWATRLKDQLGIDVVFAARGGASTIDFLRRSAIDIGAIRPDFWIILAGTNERAIAPLGNTNAWLSRMRKIADVIRGSGSVPIFATIPPTSVSSDMEFINAANSLILSRSITDAPVVDFAACLSIGGDRVTQDSSLFLPDGVHPNVAGHAAMAAQVLSDIPQIAD